MLSPRIALVLTAVLLSACLFPGSRPYTPVNEQEREALAQARREVFPEDVRRDLEGHRSTLVAWVGIVESAHWLETEPPRAELLAEHHFWDWIEDYSVQREVAFVSPRGEGRFACAVPLLGSAKVGDPLPAARSMIIAYGYPEAVGADSLVTLRCSVIRVAPDGWYGTDIWDYGREFLLRGDESDFKVLRTPM